MAKTQRLESIGFGGEKRQMNKQHVTRITMSSGSTLYLVESDNTCTIRMIRKFMDNERISDSDFRHYVRTMITR